MSKLPLPPRKSFPSARRFASGAEKVYPASLVPRAIADPVASPPTVREVPGNEPIMLRLSPDLLRRLDKARGGIGRQAYIRFRLNQDLPE